MNIEQLVKVVAEFSGKEAANTKTYIYSISNFKFDLIKEYLMINGYICKEDLDQQLYIGKLKGGFLKANTATVGICINQNKLLVAICAKEGLIKQRTCEGIINEFEREFGKYIS